MSACHGPGVSKIQEYAVKTCNGSPGTADGRSGFGVPPLPYARPGFDRELASFVFLTLPHTSWEHSLPLFPRGLALLTRPAPQLGEHLGVPNPRLGLELAMAGQVAYAAARTLLSDGGGSNNSSPCVNVSYDNRVDNPGTVLCCYAMLC